MYCANDIVLDDSWNRYIQPLHIKHDKSMEIVIILTIWVFYILQNHNAIRSATLTFVSWLLKA